MIKVAAAMLFGLVSFAAQAEETPIQGPVPPGMVIPGHAPIEGYFGNSLVARDANGKIFEISEFMPNHMYRQFVVGRWEYLPWALNNGQDSSTLCKLRTIQGIQTAWCHPFAPYKKVGDHWANPELRGGHPYVNGGIPLVKVGGKWVDPHAKPGDPPLGLIYSLEAGQMGTPSPADVTNVVPTPGPVSPVRGAK